MKLTVTKPVEIEVSFVRLVVPVRYDEDDMPNDFPFRKNDMWDVTVDIESGKILEWPEGVELDLYMKVTDTGSYYLLDSQSHVIGASEHDYVPHSVIPGDYGDYIDLEIQADGVIANWRKGFDESDITEEFFTVE